VDTTSNFTGGEESRDGLAVGTEDTGLGVDFETTHGVVEDGGHDGNIENIVHLPLAGLEEVFTEWILLGLDDVVIVLEGLLELGRADADVLGQSSTILVALHETTADVVFAVPLNLFGGFTVEDEPNWMLDAGWSVDAEETIECMTDLSSLFPDLSGDVVTVLQLIDESLAFAVEQEATDTTESLGSKELDFGPWFVRVDQTGRMHLNLLHVDSAGTDGDSDLVSVAGTVITVGGGELPELWAVLLQQGVFGEVGSVTASGQDDRTIGGLGFPTDSVLNTNDDGTILDDLGDASLFLNDDALGIADRKVLKAFHLSVRKDLRKRPGSVGTT